MEIFSAFSLNSELQMQAVRPRWCNKNQPNDFQKLAQNVTIGISFSEIGIFSKYPKVDSHLGYFTRKFVAKDD